MVKSRVTLYKVENNHNSSSIETANATALLSFSKFIAIFHGGFEGCTPEIPQTFLESCKGTLANTQPLRPAWLH